MLLRRGLFLFNTRFKLSFWRVIVFILFLVPFYNEYFSYILQSWMWKNLSAIPDDAAQIRVLFIADPQLIGMEDEPSNIGSMTRWDSDRYLSKTFRRAFDHHRPDVLVFLGDIFDEGSKATKEDYESYYQRFQDIYHTPDDVKFIYISGDNDVGGEGFDRKEEWKLTRFNAHFTNIGVSNVEFASFIRLHYDFGQFMDEKFKLHLRDLAEKSASTELRIVLNHMSVLDHQRRDFNVILRQLRPSIFFTAHTHLAKLYTCIDCIDTLRDQGIDSKLAWKGGQSRMTGNDVYHFNLNDGVTIHEVAVPTCSYRMGVPNMGYGAAVISPKEMTYTLLWLPSRYNQLYSYIFVLIAVFIAIFTKLIIFRIYM